MRFHRLPVKDPRTVARDIPGICDLLFPQLIPAIIIYLNRQAKSFVKCSSVPETLTRKMSVPAAMLFEVAYARTEHLLNNTCENWDSYLQTALKRQARFFDAQLVKNLTPTDIEIAERTSDNLLVALRELEIQQNSTLNVAPIIPGYQWIAQGDGDFSIEKTLIEVKCSSKNFGSADYRQLLIYWLLSFSGDLESKAIEWETGILLNPRLNKYIEVDFNSLISLVSAGRSKVEILELFDSIVSDYTIKLLGSSIENKNRGWA